MVFAALPLFHVNALLVTVLAPLFKGLQVVWAGPQGYRDQALYSHFWKLVERYGVTTMSAVPTVYSVLAGCPGRRRHQQPPLRRRRRLTPAAGGPGRLRVRHRHPAGRGLRPHRGHLRQRTELLPTIRVPGPSASACPYQQVKAVQVTADGEWVDLPAGQVGVLAISGPTVFPGYVTDRRS